MPDGGIVLLLEDNADILKLNRKMLEKEGVVVLAAETVAEARERLKIAVPDVAVLDVVLPDGSGVDFLAELRQVCDAPALFLTAKTERADILAGFTAGGNDYITKPYDIDEFRMRVANFLRLVGVQKTRPGYIAPQSANAALLSEKELVIAQFAVRGVSNKDIAEKVGLSESRVKTSLSAIYGKLGISGKDGKRAKLARILSGRP